MAAPQHHRADDRFDCSGFVRKVGNPIEGLLASAVSGLAAGDGDHSRREQFRPASYPQSLRDRPGDMGLSAICDNFWSDPDRISPDDEELLAAVLSEDHDPALRERLLQKFGNVSQILLADFAELVRVTGSNLVARKLKAIFDMATRLAASNDARSEAFHDCLSLVRYLQAAMGKRRVETLRVLFLDTHNRLIADQLMWEGTVDEVQIHPREVLRRALDLDSTAFLVAHNHPSQIVTPSAADIAVTRQLITASESLGVVFHDHLIVSSKSFHSMRYHGSVDPWC
jgi:DNA repair protein RadC